MAKELRVTFKENEMELYEYIRSKSSFSGFLKDLAMVEMQRERHYITCGFEQKKVNKTVEPKPVVKEVQDLDISDLDFDI